MMMYLKNLNPLISLIVYLIIQFIIAKLTVERRKHLPQRPDKDPKMGEMPLSLSSPLERQPSLLVVPPSGSVTAHILRLHPGESLMASLRSAADVILARIPPSRCSSVFVMTAVGSLQDATLRLANASKKNLPNAGSSESVGSSRGNDICRWRQRFEIVSLVGTFSRNGGCHLHISLSDSEGKTIGGHLIDGEVFTTVEVVLGTADGVEFIREHDEATGYRELLPRQLPKESRPGWWVRSGQLFLAVAFGFSVGASILRRR